MRLGVEDVFIHAIVLDLEHRVRCMDQVSVLEDLCEEERVLKVPKGATVRSVDVRDLRVSRSSTGSFGDGLECVPCPLHQVISKELAGNLNYPGSQNLHPDTCARQSPDTRNKSSPSPPAAECNPHP